MRGNFTLFPAAAFGELLSRQGRRCILTTESVHTGAGTAPGTGSHAVIRQERTGSGQKGQPLWRTGFSSLMCFLSRDVWKGQSGKTETVHGKGMMTMNVY